MPSREIMPWVGLIVYKAARSAGIIREPTVSVPIETGARPAETEMAGPEDEPPGDLRGLVITARDRGGNITL